MSGVNRPPDHSPVTGIPTQSEPPEQPPSQRIKPTDAQPQLPEKGQDIPSRPLASRTAEKSSPDLNVNTEARAEKLRQNYLQQQAVVGALETQQYLLDHLADIQQFLNYPKASSIDAPFTIICVGEKGRMTSIVPDESTVGNEEETNRLRDTVKETVKAIDHYYTREKRELLAEQLDQARGLLSGYAHMLADLGLKEPAATASHPVDLNSLANTLAAPGERQAPASLISTPKPPVITFTPEPKLPDPLLQKAAPPPARPTLKVTEPRAGQHEETSRPAPPSPSHSSPRKQFQSDSISAQTKTTVSHPKEVATEELISFDISSPPTPPAHAAASPTHSTDLEGIVIPVSSTPTRNDEAEDQSASFPRPESDNRSESESESVTGSSTELVDKETIKQFTDRLDSQNLDPVEKLHPYLVAFRQHDLYGVGEVPDITALGSRLTPPVPLAAYSRKVAHDRQGRTHLARKALLFQTMLNLHKKYKDVEAMKIPPEAAKAYQLGILCTRPNTKSLLKKDGSELDRENCRKQLRDKNIKPVIADTIATAVTGRSREPDSLPCTLMRDVERLEEMRFKNEFKVEDLESFKKLGVPGSSEISEAQSDLQTLCVEWQKLLASQEELNGNLETTTPGPDLVIKSKSSELSRMEVKAPLSGEILRKELENRRNPYLEQKKLLQTSDFLKNLYAYTPD
ncbi:MAG: hypothetical protein ACR2PT_21300 [Endozoicomonas sp.]